jgi:oxalate decarboxylase
MAGETEKDLLSRRGFLGVSSAALAAASVLGPDKMRGQEGSAQIPKGDRSASDPGPTNSVIDAANPDSNHPLPSDAGGVQTFKYPFSFAHKRFQEGGWSREVTVRELAVSKSLAGVDMRLTAGGVRELHWHTAAEWAYMLYGSARITCVDFDGKSFVTDVKEGDLW